MISTFRSGLIVMLVASMLMLPALVSAQSIFDPAPPATESCKGEGIFDNPLNSCDLGELLMNVLRGIVRVLMIVLVVAYVFVGFQFVTAQGNTEKLSKARNSLMWTVIGTAILLGAEGIAEIIKATGSSLVPK